MRYILILVILGIVGCGKEEPKDNKDHSNKKTLANLQTGKWCTTDMYCYTFESDGTWFWRLGDGMMNYTSDIPEHTYSVSGKTIFYKQLQVCDPSYPTGCTYSDVTCTIVDETYIQCGSLSMEQKL